MKTVFFYILFQIPFYLFSQFDNEFINWNENRKLVWNDFKASPKKLGDVAALTATHLGFSYQFTNGNISYNIECRFENNKSWVLVKNDWILQHEQGHFDIAEIFARKLNKAMSEYQLNKNSFQKDLDAIYNSIVTEKESFQQQYDDETDYSRNKVKQEEWLLKISRSLQDNKKWAGYN